MKKLIVVLLIALAGGAGFYWSRGRLAGAAAAAPAADALFSARRGDLRIAVSENGYLKAKNNVEISPQFKRGATITWLIEEGSEVKEGDLLAEFDKSELDTQVESLRTSLIQYQTELEAAKADLQIQERENQATIEKAEMQAEIAQLNLQKHEEGEAPNRLRQLQLGAEKAKSEYERAKEKFEQVPELLEQGFLTKIQVEEERIRLREAEINMENADKELELHVAYTAPIELRQKLADKKDAERLLANAREKTDISLKEKQARVFRQEQQVKSTETRLDELLKEVEAMTIKAPGPGLVHYGDPRNPWMHDEIKVGNMIHRGMVLITLPDLSSMQVLADIHEADVDMIKLDQEVVITLDAVKGRSFKGKVIRIDAVAQEDWSDSSNKTFGVEIDMEQADVPLRAGITAKIEIQVEVLKDVLQIPIQAVFSEEGASFVFVPAADGAFQQRGVKIGKNNAHYVEILEGLSAGEQVLLYDPRDSGAVGREAEEGGSPAAPAEQGGGELSAAAGPNTQ